MLNKRIFLAMEVTSIEQLKKLKEVLADRERYLGFPSATLVDENGKKVDSNTLPHEPEYWLRVAKEAKNCSISCATDEELLAGLERKHSSFYLDAIQWEITRRHALEVHRAMA